ncbi:MAG: hypothetical protein Q9P90_10945 [candidate division KSB1 bacterium]|nr:hypothetical protein [candidate division KSB1 bacterium]
MEIQPMEFNNLAINHNRKIEGNGGHHIGSKHTKKKIWYCFGGHLQMLVSIHVQISAIATIQHAPLFVIQAFSGARKGDAEMPESHILNFSRERDCGLRH